MKLSYRAVGIVGAVLLAAVVGANLLGRVGLVVPLFGAPPRITAEGPTPTADTPTPSPDTVVSGEAVSQAPPQPSSIYFPYVPVPAPDTPTPPPSTIYIPYILVPGAESTMVPTETPTPTPTAPPNNVPSVAMPTAQPVTTRGPIRITKLGLGVYASGGGMLGILDHARPSVILLMDPSQDFAREVRRRFPNAFIVGRIFATSQPLDNPAQRGSDFADRVAGTAVPLKGIVDAWMSYNEVANHDDPTSMINYNTFQVAFAHRLQDVYGIPAVAGNDGPRAIPAEFYPKYFAEAIRTSRYFGFHSYPDPNVKSLRDPLATDQVFYYRKIHAALDAAGIKAGPFLATEIGLYNGWRDVTSDTDMANDFTWVADQMNNDPYILGMMIFGTFTGNQWYKFEIGATDIPSIAGDYNTVH